MKCGEGIKPPETHGDVSVKKARNWRGRRRGAIPTPRDVEHSPPSTYIHSISLLPETDRGPFVFRDSR